jgi:hypothetical protein
MNQILEQVNAIMGTFHREELMAEDAKQYEVENFLIIKRWY